MNQTVGYEVARWPHPVRQARWVHGWGSWMLPMPGPVTPLGEDGRPEPPTPPDAPRPFLVVEGVPSEPAETDPAAVGRELEALARDGGPDELLDFARRYGPFGVGADLLTHRARKGAPVAVKAALQGEPLDLLGVALAELRLATRLVARDADPDGWVLRDAQAGGYRVCAPSPFPIWLRGFRGSGPLMPTSDGGHLVSTDTYSGRSRVEAGRAFARELIRLRCEGFSRYVWIGDDLRREFYCPLGVGWWHLAAQLRKGTPPRLCVECRQVFSQGLGAKGKDARFCSDKCQARDVKRRKERAAELAARGWGADRIAEELGMSKTIARRWVEKQNANSKRTKKARKR